MDPMGNAKKAAEDPAETVVVQSPRIPSLLPAALPSAGAAQFAAAFFPPNARAPGAAAAAFTGRHLPGTPSACDIFLPGAYPRSLEPATAYQHLHYPYNMAIAKGSSFEGEGSVTKKPRTVFTPKQLLYLEEEFSGNQFPNMEQRKKIAKTLDLTQQHIQIWFQNRRAKKRRKKKRYSEEEKMRKDPEPPPFWPSNLPFSSNLGDISKKSMDKLEDRSIANEATKETVALETNGRGPPYVSQPQASKQSPTAVAPDTHHPKDYTPPPTLSPTSFPPLNNKHAYNNPHDASRPSHLPCSNQELPLMSPVQARTPGSRHSQLPTPPPYVPPTTHCAVGSALMMTHPTTREAVLTPPGNLTIHSYPPLPSPESLLAGNFDDPGSFPPGLVPPLYDSVASFNTAARAGRGIIPPPPPYSFGSSHASNMPLSSQLSYTADHHSTTTSNHIFVSPLSLTSSSRLPEARSNPLPSASDTTARPSPLSPSTLSPLTNSDCSPSPIMQDVALPAPSTLPSERTFPSLSSSSAGPSSGMKQHDCPSQELSSPIHATDPVALTDLQEEWDFFSRAVCPVIQTDHEMWAAVAPPPPHHVHPRFVRRKPGPATSSGNSLASLGTPSPYSGVYGVGYLPPFNSDPAAAALANYAAVTNISNGAN